MKTNYFSIHRNKKPKRTKYSKPYSKKEYKNMDKCLELFKQKINKIKSC